MRVPNLNKYSIKTMGYRKYAAAVVFIVIFALIGVIILTSSHASGPYTSIEASSGTLTGSASNGSDANASDGSYVKFGTAGSTSSGAQPYDPDALIGSNWTRVFYDDFSGTSLNTANWAPDWYSDGHQAPGYSWYTESSQVSVNNGLFLASDGSTSGKGGLICSINNCGETPGFMFNNSSNTAVSGNFTQAYAEIYWKLPVNSNGIENTATFWINPPDWSNYSGATEIDIAETYGGGSSTHLHYGDEDDTTYGSLVTNQPASDFTGSGGTWMYYGLLWTASKLEIFYNGTPIGTYNNGDNGTDLVPTQREGIVVNYGAESYGSGANIAAATAQVAHVAVWQR